MSITYHHYGATVLNMPITQLPLNMLTILRLPIDRVGVAAHATIALEETGDGVAHTHTLTYRSNSCAAELAEYVVTCTLRPVADAPHTTFFEWMRAYRPATSVHDDQICSFVSAMVDQDQAIAARLAAECGGEEVLCIDYTLGAAPNRTPAGGER
jgi:hypothetical protein